MVIHNLLYTIILLTYFCSLVALLRLTSGGTSFASRQHLTSVTKSCTYHLLTSFGLTLSPSQSVKELVGTKDMNGWDGLWSLERISSFIYVDCHLIHFFYYYYLWENYVHPVIIDEVKRRWNEGNVRETQWLNGHPNNHYFSIFGAFGVASFPVTMSYLP